MAEVLSVFDATILLHQISQLPLVLQQNVMNKVKSGKTMLQ